MLKSELEAWKKSAEVKCKEAHDLIDGKNFGDIKLEDMQSIWKKMREILGLEIPKEDE
tara:strand:- start:94 stop:267 length:174 start_codon:yes stop_codon:yes gene_type:complete